MIEVEEGLGTKPKIHLAREEPTEEKQQLLKPEKMNDSSVPKAKWIVFQKWDNQQVLRKGAGCITEKLEDERGGVYEYLLSWLRW